MFGFGRNNIKRALRKGAIIIDVRPPNEFDRGRVPDSINIPVDRFSINIMRIKNMNCPVIICGDSWQQANAAVKMLKQNGLKEVYNGESWDSLAKLVKRI
jgi:phage shock protein E